MSGAASLLRSLSGPRLFEPSDLVELTLSTSGDEGGLAYFARRLTQDEGARVSRRDRLRAALVRQVLAERHTVRLKVRARGSGRDASGLAVERLQGEPVVRPHRADAEVRGRPWSHYSDS
jgi:hypothetical protein